MEINELINNRKEFVDAQIKNGFDLTTVLVGLYSDASHFVYEILQNAEDAHATDITFELQTNQLVISHNGAPFSQDDIEAITGISNIENDKKKDREKIGKFGIGFKSVYAITKSPRIQSGKYDFEIVNFVLPSNFSETNNFAKTTITLTFNHSQLNSNAAIELIQTKFENFEFYNLLFLSRLKIIRLIWPSNKKIFTKKEKLIKDSNNANDVIINVGNERHRYLIFKTPVKHVSFSSLKNKPLTAIAFKKDVVNNAEEIVKADSSNLFAFFETEYETFLNFMLQAPFSTTPARDNIDFKISTNLALLDELCMLMSDAMAYLKNSKLITTNLLNQLPININIEENKLVYRRLFEAVKTEFLSGKKYLPSIVKNQYQSANDLIIVRGRELTNVISKVDDLQSLFGKKYWIDTKITIDRTPELFVYLTKILGINEYGPEDFARRVTEGFLQSKPDIWMQRFYEFLNGKQESLWRSGKGKEEGLLRKKPIIRLANGKQIMPYDIDGKPIVFLPMENGITNYNTVSPKVLQSKNSLQFIKVKLGIKEPDLFDEIKLHIIPLYKNGSAKVNIRDNLKHLRLVLEFYEKASPTVRSDLAALFENTDVKFIRTINAETGEICYQNYQYVYLPTPSLQLYFRFSGEIYFLDDSAYKSLEKEVFLSFLKKCGVKDYAWKTEFTPSLSNEILNQLRAKGNNGESRKSYWAEEKIIDYNLEGLNDIISQPVVSIEDSILIWNVLLTCIQNDSHNSQLFKGEYKWFYYSQQRVGFRSSLLTTLQTNNWLYTEENFYSPKKPSEIILSELSKKYFQNSAEAEILISNLQFRTKVEQQLLDQMPEDRKKAFDLFEAARLLCAEKGIDMLTALNSLTQTFNRDDEKHQLDNAPDLDNVEVEEEKFIGFNDTHVQAGIIDSNKNNNDENPNDDTLQTKQSTMSQDMKNKLGDRGENIVFMFLKKEWNKKATLLRETANEMLYQKDGLDYQILLLNSAGKKGTGCDIVIRNAETICEYIEVKTTKLINKDLFPVNGFQWSLAQKLFKEGDGNKFFFYIIKDVLGEKPKVTMVKNPVQKWKDGKLRAHPVNLEL